MQAASAFPRNAGQRGARPTQAIAHAAGWDAGNRAMRAAGRTAWNEDDWDAACEVFNRLMRIVDADAALAAAQAAAEALMARGGRWIAPDALHRVPSGSAWLTRLGWLALGTLLLLRWRLGGS